MSHPNVSVYRAMIDALRQGDTERFLTHVTEEVTWWDVGDGSPLIGKEAVRHDVEALSLRARDGETHDVLGNEEHVVALIHATATIAGEETDIYYAEILHYEDGLVVKRQAFPSDIWKAVEWINERG